MAQPPQQVLELIQRFDRNREAYHSPHYNETQLRREFLDPFFKALGWDIDNEQGYAEAYKDVVHEDTIKVGEGTKAPDYCFRIGGTRKFFLEAKRPSVDIKNDASPAFQLRRYGWTEKLALSVLSNFEEFAVYDCRFKPDNKHNAAFGRVLYIPYSEYARRWDEIEVVFSRDAVLKGAFDKFAESIKAKSGTIDVDDDFLNTIETWRADLARILALRNANLSQRELNFSVQRVIDRIIFLRICEDRGIEDQGRLRALTNGDRIYPRLCQLFEEADTRYNSGLFHFKPERGRHEAPDELTLALHIDDKLLRDILKSLYYPDSPYVFARISADILGQVYEQFLGKVIRLTEGHRAVVEKKPAVKKASGVYYTPVYIVNYIVQTTVGHLLENKNPKQAAKLKILDPACGSGSFLIGAYEYLLNWHREFYTMHDPAKWAKGPKPALVQVGQAEWKLTIAERKRILLDNIFGVDIDSQAVETTKLSLLLKVLEGETQQSLQPVLRIFHQRALPDLGDNIKCGNSLIGPDFYDQQQMTLLDEEERYRVNVFDWQAEFPLIFWQKTSPDQLHETPASPLDYTWPGVPLHGSYSRRKIKVPQVPAAPVPLEPKWDGGFDAVIGNPPFVLLQGDCRDEKQLEYFRAKFASASFKIDTYHLFMEQVINLGRSGGMCSMITPANFLTNNHLDKLRRLMLNRSAIERILVIDGGVFRGVSVDNAIFLVRPGQPTRKNFPINHACMEAGKLKQTTATDVSPQVALENEHVLFTGTTDAPTGQLWKKIASRSWSLGDIADVNFGKQLRDRKKFPEDVVSVPSARAIPASHRACYTGRDVNRYSLAWGNLACLESGVARCGGCWDKAKHEAKNKLVTRQIGRYPDFALDTAGWHCLNTMFMVNVRGPAPDPRFVLGILNSKLLRRIWLDRFYDQRRTFPKIKGTYLKQLPIPRLDFSNPSDESRHDQLVQRVEQMLALHQRRSTAKTPQEQNALERQITAADTQIDRLVFDLYGLTENEIKIVDGATP
jgi:type I restriction-modification system DNA methylase subunit